MSHSGKDNNVVNLSSCYLLQLIIPVVKFKRCDVAWKYWGFKLIAPSVNKITREIEREIKHHPFKEML